MAGLCKNRALAELIRCQFLAGDGGYCDGGPKNCANHPDAPHSTPGIESVLSEHAKQVRKWGDAHDDQHAECLLSGAGTWLALYGPPPNCGCREAPCFHGPMLDYLSVPDWVLELAGRHDRRERLVMAATFIIREIDRMDRAKKSQGGGAS